MNSKGFKKKKLKSSSSEGLVWKGVEEVSALQGLIDFKGVTGNNPFDNEEKAYKFLQLEYVPFEDNTDEFEEKMRNLKEKLMDKMRKPKDPKTSELLKRIFGYDVEPEVEKPESSQRKSSKQVISHEGEKWYENAAMVGEIVSRGGDDESSLTRKWASVPKKKKKMMDEKWSVLLTKEIETVSEKAELVNDLVSMIKQASKSH